MNTTATRTVAAFGIMLFMALAAGCTKSKTTVTPERRSITQAVYASGKIFPVGFHRVSSKVPGIVDQILVKAGDSVTIGQPLLRIRATSSDLAVETAQTLYGLADENASDKGALLRSVMADLEAARSKYVLDSTNAARTRRLLTQQATSQSNYDAAKTQFEVSQRQYEKVRDVYESTRRRLAAERRTAQLNVSIQRSLRDEFVLTASASGRVYDVIPKVGELVMPQQPLVEIGESSSIEVELAIDESDIALVAVGQRVAYSVDAVKGRTFGGVIVSITPRVSGVDKTVSVTASIDADAVQLLPGMSLEANIVVSSRSRALVLPREAVPIDHMVTVRRNGEEMRVKLITGVEDLRYVEIISGLNDADEVVL
ncbi:MAG: HlyD family efflux transporter periplasmic adaptor subunit [Candidatus Kapabacteria bacterium]|nr:HlyD family efflux transporter periplasmic adaptor subunit [Candidatus Kapabacteria bacterium]